MQWVVGIGQYWLEETIWIFYLPWSLSKSARNIVDIGSNLLDLEAHDNISWEVSHSLGMVADGRGSREGENIRDGSTDELEGVTLIAS